MAIEPSSATTQASVSESNRARILRHLYHHGVSSRAQIAKTLGLTPAAITKITARLLEAGVIEETGGIEGEKNRRSIGLKLDVARFHIIAVKFARSLVRIAVFDLSGAEISNRTLPPVTNDTIADTLSLTHEIIEGLLAEDPAIVAIGMVVPGPYLRHIGRTAVVSTMQGWRKVNFMHEFEHAFRVPVFIEHDARAGALAQHLYGTGLASDDGRMPDSLAYYLVGEGVGLGVIDQGRLINGAMGTATEIGHISIDVDGRPCDCGNVGCLERYCSASAIHERIDAAEGLVPGSADMSHADACRALFDLAASGDARAKRIVTDVSRIIGYGAVAIINAYNPSLIVIGDIVSGAGDALLREARNVVDRRVVPELADGTAITLSALPSDATLCGAAAVATNRFLDHPSEFFSIE